MALLLPPISFFSASSYSSPSPAIPIAASLCKASILLLPASRLQQKCLILQPRSFSGVRIPAPLAFGEKGSMIVGASAENEGKNGDVLETASTEGSEAETVSIENLPLESKERLKLEQKLRMKLAKKIRLRRKRLVRKRRMRKKGRWPPSKMKKNKNV